MNCFAAWFLSNLTSLPEIGGDIAFYFSSFDPEHMHQVYQQGMSQYASQDMYKAIVQRGREFDWEKNALKYLEVYKSLYWW